MTKRVRDRTVDDCAVQLPTECVKLLINELRPHMMMNGFSPRVYYTIWLRDILSFTLCTRRLFSQLKQLLKTKDTQLCRLFKELLVSYRFDCTHTEMSLEELRAMEAISLNTIFFYVALLSYRFTDLQLLDRFLRSVNLDLVIVMRQSDERDVKPLIAHYTQCVNELTRLSRLQFFLALLAYSKASLSMLEYTIIQVQSHTSLGNLFVYEGVIHETRPHILVGETTYVQYKNGWMCLERFRAIKKCEESSQIYHIGLARTPRLAEDCVIDRHEAPQAVEHWKQRCVLMHTKKARLERLMATWPRKKD
jgi:hypothetical protein